MEYLLPFCRNARDASAFKDCCSKIVRLKFIPASIQVGLFGSAVRIQDKKDGYQYSLILLLYSSTRVGNQFVSI